MKKLFLFSAFAMLVAVTQIACEKAATSYAIPTTYNFENVNYANQTKRVSMLVELTTYANSANALGAASLSEQKMLDMFCNDNAPFADAYLNGSTSQLKNKTHTSMQTALETYMSALAAVSEHTSQAASDGQAGIIVSTVGDAYLLNDKGFDLAQIIDKVTAGACFYNQASEVYLGIGKMTVDNKVVIAGKGTTMEHHWDEAFGYFGAPIDFPTNTANLDLWAKYSNKIDVSLDCNKIIMDAFLKGRAAISAHDLDARDAAIVIIRREWERIVAAVAISYMNEAKTNRLDPAIYYHSLSKAYAFILSLKYGGNPTMSNAETDALLVNLAGSSDVLTANLYNTRIANINATINSLANRFPTLEICKNSL